MRWPGQDLPWSRRSLLVAGGSFVAGTAVTMAVGDWWRCDMAVPRVVALGAGNRLSVLVTAGAGRLLIATGDDAIGFGNALARARHSTTRRIDVLLLAGRGRDLFVPAAIRDEAHVRYAASLGPLPNTAEGEAVRAGGLPVLPSPRRIRLPRDVVVRIDVTESPATGDDDGVDVAWRAVVRRAETTVVIYADAEDAVALLADEPVSAVIVGGTDPLRVLELVESRVLVVSADEVPGRDLRRDAARVAGHDLWAVSVFSGEAARLDFVEGGLRLPRESSHLLRATPEIETGKADVAQRGPGRSR